MTVYKVLDTKNQTVVKETYSRLLAYRFAHKKDAEYGAVRYIVFFEQDTIQEDGSLKSRGEISNKKVDSL